MLRAFYLKPSGIIELLALSDRSQQDLLETSWTENEDHSLTHGLLRELCLLAYAWFTNSKGDDDCVCSHCLKPRDLSGLKHYLSFFVKCRQIDQEGDTESSRLALEIVRCQ